jgi:hypothetical protein
VWHGKQGQVMTTDKAQADNFARRLVMQHGMDAGRRWNDLMALYTSSDEQKALTRRYYNKHVNEIKNFLFEGGK